MEPPQPSPADIGPTLASFQADLARLVARFSSQLPFHASPEYSVAKLREDFLNPFFAALGWDAGNRKALIHTGREVDVEARTAFSGRQRRAHYVFRVDRVEWFACEANKPSESFHGGHAHQAKSDAHARGVPFAVLSDFEETRLYVIGARPRRAGRRPKASVERAAPARWDRAARVGRRVHRLGFPVVPSQPGTR